MQTIRILGGGLFSGRIFYASLESLRTRFGNEFRDDDKFFFLDEKLPFLDDLNMSFNNDGSLNSYSYLDADSSDFLVTSELFHVDPNDLKTFLEIIKND